MLRGAACSIALAILAACNDQSRRPPFADGDEDKPSPAGEDADVPYLPLPTSQDGPCDTRIEVPIVKPNFYFVLDASGSMLENMPGTSDNRYRTAVSAISDMLTPMQEHVNFGAAVFPNSFNGASCEAGNEVFKLREGSNQGQSSSPLQSLITTLRGYIPEGGSPVSPTLRELYPTLRDLPGKTFVVLLSDGAPNCNLSRSCSAQECILNLEGVEFSDGTMCNDDFNCCAADWFPHLCLDSDPTLDEISRLAKLDVSTYVIGLPGGVPFADLLNQMAIAGGTARDKQPTEDVERTQGDASAGDAATRDAGVTGEAPDDGLLYYQATDAESLGVALSSVRQDVLIDCTLDLDFAPTSPELLEVTAGDEELETESWRLVADTRIELLGAVCEEWKAGQLTDVRVRQTCRGDVR
jgi:hypothetical protein